MAEITFFEGRPDFQWEQDLLLVLASSGITNNAGTVTLYYDGPDADLLPDAELILTGTGLDEFYGGYVGAFTFKIGGTVIFTALLNTPIAATIFGDARATVGSIPITVADTEAFKAVFKTFMASEVAILQGSRSDDAFFRGNFMADAAFGGGGDDYFRLGNGLDNIEGGGGFDFLDLAHDGMAIGVKSTSVSRRSLPTTSAPK